ncbi:hypothetical protein [Sinorhizobium meliloti]|uniref:hypothetical protein n=1 Tax=Rhizobium meliloti TaxID=382 RepID=UPI000FD9286F|nr:hypothetical protein [Sinorhizobium meliloti]RVI34232.1 hypothetical protein CN207_01175 [Sinorhizobium meliloti]
METDIHMKAVRRYGALVGDLEDMSLEEREQARVDIEDYAAEYVPECGCGWGKATLLLRFLHEVCHIPLWQARACAVVVFRQNEGYIARRSDPEFIASRLVQETGNVLVAEATAALYLAAAEETPWECFWKEVLQAMTYGQPMEGGHGGENVTLH